MVGGLVCLLIAIGHGDAEQTDAATPQREERARN